MTYNEATEKLLDIADTKETTAEQVKALIEAGADVNVQNDNGETALMWSAWHNSNPEVIALINAGADVNLKDKDGKTAKDWAVQSNASPEIIKILEGL